MTITGADTEAYNANENAVETAGEHSDERISIWQLPKIVFAGAGLFVVNAVIGIGMLITPNIQADVYGHEVEPVHFTPSSKVSPFTEVVDTQKHKVKLAAKLYPVVFEPSYTEELSSAADAAVGPGTSPRSTWSYQLDIPARTVPAAYRPDSPSPDSSVSKNVYGDALHSTARLSGERQKEFVVIN